MKRHMYYDQDLDYLEILKKNTSKTYHDLGHGVSEILSETSQEVVGYAFENTADEVTRSSLLTEEDRSAAIKFMGILKKLKL